MIITVLSGSPRINSLTQRAALFLQKELKTKGHEVHLIDMREIQLEFVQSV
jgi:NAD(P)H-dependent FMN reductase